MKISKIVIVVGLLAAISLSACAQPENAQVPNTGEMTQTPDTMMGTEMPMEETATMDSMAETPDAMMATATGDAMMEKTPDAMMATATGDAMMEAPEWFSTTFTDVRTGEAFTINDFKGKVVVVQTVATGCAGCMEQGQQIQTLSEMLGSDSEVVFVGLDGDPQDDAAGLMAYVEENGLDGNYAIAPKAVIDELNSLYGTQFFDASTPSILIIDTKGEAHPLEAGVMNADALKKAIEMYTGME